LKLASEIGRTDGGGARRRRREHHRAHSTLGCDVRAAVTALLKAGVKRRTEAEKHVNAPRIAGPDRIRMTEFSALAIS
jgi:hypothetical protein